MTPAPEHPGVESPLAGRPLQQQQSTPIGSAYNETLWEVRLCFAVAAACGVVGSLGWLFEQFNPGSNSLPSLIVVGAFYALMGVVRAFRLPFTPREPREPGRRSGPSRN